MKLYAAQYKNGFHF